jgi:pyruvate ferredoxin oxidoreductase alpha subunit
MLTTDKTMPKKINVEVFSGNEAIANALVLVDPDVVPTYPITPQTIIVERFADFWADGKVNSEVIHVESEHSAMSAAVGAAATGSRVFTASSSQGIALMFEILFIAAGNRLPIVMAVANRALAAPINIHGELTDQLVTRDTGWISLFGETAQEAYDQTIMSFKIAENKDVLLPTMYGVEGFIVSHAIERVETLDKKSVQDFIGGRREFDWAFRPNLPGSQGMLALPDYYMELKYQQEVAMKKAKLVIPKVYKEFGELTGRYYNNIDLFYMDDAEYAFITIGAISGSALEAVKKLRKLGLKVGLVKIRTYRPFPSEEIVNALKDVKGAILLDRSLTFGNPTSIIHNDISSSFVRYNKMFPILSSMRLGIGGRDVSIEDIIDIYHSLVNDVKKQQPSFNWWNLRL